MIVEGAFLKLPELLTRDYDLLRGTSEATVVHLLSVAVLMELNARTVPRPFTHIEVEKPYPVRRRDDGMMIRADLFVNLKDAIPGIMDGPLTLYGTSPDNWIEAKAFVSSIKRGAMPARTANAGRIVKDLLRLWLLPGQRLQNRYLLLVFSSEPSQSVAMQTSDRRDRVWLSRLLTEGCSNVRINLADEAKSLREAVGPGFVDSGELEFDVKVRTMAFEPKGKIGSSPAFWGYLVRLLSGQISIPGLQDEGFNAIRDEVMARWRGSTGEYDLG